MADVEGAQEQRSTNGQDLLRKEGRPTYARAEENPESARSVICAIFSAHSAYFNVSRQKVP